MARNRSELVLPEGWQWIEADPGRYGAQNTLTQTIVQAPTRLRVIDMANGNFNTHRPRYKRVTI